MRTYDPGQINRLLLASFLTRSDVLPLVFTQSLTQKAADLRETGHFHGPVHRFVAYRLRHSFKPFVSFNGIYCQGQRN